MIIENPDPNQTPTIPQYVVETPHETENPVVVPHANTRTGRFCAYIRDRNGRKHRPDKASMAGIVLLLTIAIEIHSMTDLKKKGDISDKTIVVSHLLYAAMVCFVKGDILFPVIFPRLAYTLDRLGLAMVGVVTVAFITPLSIDDPSGKILLLGLFALWVLCLIILGVRPPFLK